MVFKGFTHEGCCETNRQSGENNTRLTSLNDDWVLRKKIADVVLMVLDDISEIIGEYCDVVLNNQKLSSIKSLKSKAK